MSQHRQFGLSAVPKGLDGITSELVSGLHDAAWAWGALDPMGGRVYLWLQEPREVRIIVHDDLENVNFAISATRADPRRGQYHHVGIGNHATVAVDWPLTVADLFCALEAIRAIAVVKDRYDPRKDRYGVGDRTRQIIPLKAGLMFSGVYSRLIPQGRDIAELVRAQFDYPGSVAIIPGLLEVPTLCHARNARAQTVNYAIETAVYREHGVAGLDALRTMQKEHFAALERKVRARLAGVA